MANRKEFKWINVMTPEAANKVAGWDAGGNPVLVDLTLLEHFKGSYATLIALNAAVPAAEPGDYAIVNAAATDVVFYVWDEDDTQWVAVGMATTGSNGITVVTGDVRLGGAISLATILNITTGSLTVTGSNQPFTVKSTSGIAPKIRIEGDQTDANGRNWELEPANPSAGIRGLQLKYSTAQNTAPTIAGVLWRDNGWVEFNPLGTLGPLAALQVNSSTGGILIPRMNTAQRDALVTPQDGTIIYNSQTAKFTVRQSAAWVEMLSGLTPQREVFRFNSSLFTEDQRLFVGRIGTLSGNFSLELTAISFEVRLDSASSWTVIADIGALQTWITANTTGNWITGTKYWVKVLATYAASAVGIAEYSLVYTPT